MNRNEVKKVLMIIQATYPNFKPNVDLSTLIDVWSTALADADGETVTAALYAYIRSSSTGFAPTIGQLMSTQEELSSDNSDQGEIVWNQYIKKALRNSIYGSDEEFEKLPDAAKEIIKTPGTLAAWAKMDSGEVDTVNRSQFIKAYNIISDRAKKRSVVNADVLKKLSTTQQSTPMIEMVDGRNLIDETVPTSGAANVPSEVDTLMERLRKEKWIKKRE